MIGWALDMLVATSALTLLVLAVRRAVADLFGAGWAYALWLLPAVRIVAPPFSWFGSDLPLGVVDIAALGEAAAPLPSQGGPGQWVPILLALWAGGAVLFLAWQARAYRVFLRDIAATSRPAYPSRYEGLEVTESRAVAGPVAIGLLNPRIVVPYDFLSRYSRAEQELALEHERLHLCRGDLWWNCLGLLILGAQWFNPIAWIGFRAFRADQELACDAKVARRLTPDRRHEYASALIKSASRPGLIAACPLNHVVTLKRRLKMMKHHRDSRVRSMGGWAAFSGLLLAGLAVSAPGHAQDEAPDGKAETRVVIREVGKGEALKLGEGELAKRLEKCPEAQRLVSEVSSGDGAQSDRVRVVICGENGQPTPEMREKLVAALDRARARIGSDEKLDPAQRAKLAEALRQELEQVRAKTK